MNILRTILAFLMLAVAILWNDSAIRAQQNLAPLRGKTVAEYLRILSFEDVARGVRAMKGLAPNGVELVALRIDPEKVRFTLVLSDTPLGERVDKLGRLHKGLIAFNGGFFQIDKKGRKLPVGLLKKSDIEYSQAWKKSGGYLVFDNDGISILATSGNPIPKAGEVLQSKPVLIEPNGKWAMNTNRKIRKRRTIVCIGRAGEITIVAIAGSGLSLYEAGWIMRGKNVGGYFDCDSALAMDGGGSTQIWVKDRPDLSFGGITPIHNAIIIR